MKRVPLSAAILALAFILWPLVASAQTIVFQDTFTRYGGTNSFNFGAPVGPPDSTTFWTFTNVKGFPGYSQYLVPGETKPFPTPVIPGRVPLTHFICETVAGWNTTGKPGNVNNIVNFTTRNNTPLFIGTGNYAANTTYTLTVLVACLGNLTPDVTAELFLADFNDPTTPLASVLLSKDADNPLTLTPNFISYTLTYTTGASGTPIGDPIQIGLEAIQDNIYTYNQTIGFNNVILTATPKTPAPATGTNSVTTPAPTPSPTTTTPPAQ